MAGDWIKMRTDLYRDPKVCIIADLLMDVNSELSSYVNQNNHCDMSVTRNVMRNVTVGALVSVWGVLRHRGKRNGDDLCISKCSITVIDDLAELPGFGNAMAHVGWVEENDEGIVLPRFFEEFNVDPSEDVKAKNAERQRRFRDKHKAENNVTCNVTVASQSNAREEKRREEINPPSEDRREKFAPPISSELLQSWKEVRKAKRAGAITAIVWKAIERESSRAGITPEEAIQICCERGWQSFNADWDWKPKAVASKIEKPWFLTSSGIEAKVAEIGFDTQGELMVQYKPRLFKQVGVTPDMVRAASQDFPA